MSAFFAYRNEGGIFIWKIVVKVALFYTKNVVKEVGTFLHQFIPSPWR
jgi:hypothetical protein